MAALAGEKRKAPEAAGAGRDARVSTPPAPPRPPQMASTASVPDAKVEPPAPVAVAASSGGASGMAAQGVSQHLSNPTIAHIVTGGIGFRG